MSLQTPDTAGTLERLNTTPPLRRYVASLWARREFAVAMALGEFRSKHMNTMLGGLWNLLNPLLLLGVYWLVFGVILGTNRGVENFVAFLGVGIFVFFFSQRSFISGGNSLGKHQGLIRSLQFPRALLPISAVVKELLALRSAYAVVIVIVLATGEGISWRWALVLPVIALQFVFNLGGALLLAPLSDRIKDTANVLPFVFRILFYLSGVLFLVDRFISDPLLRAAFVINPFYSFVSLPREYMMSTIEQDGIGWMWLSIGVWSVAMFLVGLLVFRAGEASYGRG